MCMICNNKSIKYICDICYKKYPIDLQMEYIPLDKYNLYIVSLSNKKICFDYNYYFDDYNYIFNFFNKLGYHIILIDELKLEIDDIYMLDGISKLIDNDILIMTFNMS